MEPATFFFDVNELKVISAWASQQPMGLDIQIMCDDDGLEEVAEVFRTDPELPLWFIASAGPNQVLLTDNSGPDPEIETIETVEAALARILEEEHRTR